MLTQSIYNRLLETTAITDVLPTYQGVPNIFSGGNPPEDIELPYIDILGPITDTPFDTKTNMGRQTSIDVAVYDDIEKGSAKNCAYIAEIVRQALHRNPLDLTSGENIILECYGPLVSDDTEAFGRVITATITYMES